MEATSSTFELPDYRSIARDNWELLEPWFAYGDGRGKDSQLKWFAPLIEIRNRTAHPERGPVSGSEIEFIHQLVSHVDQKERLVVGANPRALGRSNSQYD